MLKYASEELKNNKALVMDAVNPDLKKNPEVILEMMKRLGLGEAKYAAPNVEIQPLLKQIPAENYVGSCKNISIFDKRVDNDSDINQNDRTVSHICSFIDVQSLLNFGMCSKNANEIANKNLKQEIKSACP